MFKFCRIFIRVPATILPLHSTPLHPPPGLLSSPCFYDSTVFTPTSPLLYPHFTAPVVSPAYVRVCVYVHGFKRLKLVRQTARNLLQFPV